MTDKIIYNEDLEYIVSLLQWFYLWPKSNRAEDINSQHYIKSACILLFFTLPLWGTYFHTLKYFNHLDDSSMTLDLVIIVITIALLLMFIIYIFNSKNIVRNTNSYIRLDRTINYKRHLRVMYAILLGLCITVLIVKTLENPMCEKRKKFQQSFESCGYLFPIYIPFSYDMFPFREIIIMWQSICVVSSFMIAANLIMLMVYFLEKMMVYLRNLRRNIMNINSFVMEDKNVANVLGEYVDLHNKILEGIGVFNDTCRYINLTHFAMGSIVLAILVVDIIKTKNIQSIMQFFGWAPSLFIFTWFCQNVRNEGMKLESALYDIKWYKMSIGNQKVISLMLTVAQRPLGIEAGPFRTFCLESFVGVLRGTYSYVTMFIDF